MPTLNLYSKSMKQWRGNVMKKYMMNFLNDESGATAIEYALIVCLISIVIITAAGNVGTNLTSKFTKIANSLT